MSKQQVMVELHSGYGDGYGVVLVDDGGNPVVNAARKVTKYVDGTAMDEWRAKILSSPSVTLVDAGVRVPPGAIKRVIGPLDCDEAVRVRARRYTRNWHDNGFVERATDDELRAAMGCRSEADTYAACCGLRDRYSAKGE